MSRSGYSDDCEHLAMWRGQVASAIRGKRGQKFLCDLASVLDAMPEKKLIANKLEQNGQVCAMGALGRVRGVDMTKIDPNEPMDVADAFDIAHQLAQEVAFENDEGAWGAETPEYRWKRIRKWVAENIKATPPVTP